jgi:alpha-1,3-fucosyltransferase
VKNKTKTAAWIYSVRNTSSIRINLYSKLKEIIDIDVYGKDQMLQCEPYPARCVKTMGETYKFYLAFENSLCEDYLTEKTFRAIEDNVVPVIYSGANITRFLPPNSYIDANSFATVKDLGEYLKFLSHNQEEYIKFFWWKKYYKIEQWWIDMCEVCMKLNNFLKQPKQKTYNIHEFYFKDKCFDHAIKF